MSTPTPSIPGVDRDALAGVIRRELACSAAVSYRATDAVLAHIAAHQECACDREQDEWVEVDAWGDLPEGALVRREWKWDSGDAARFFIHRDDMPDDPRALIARELGAAKADTFLGLLDEHGWAVTRKGER